jgi:hypothetical protein
MGRHCPLAELPRHPRQQVPAEVELFDHRRGEDGPDQEQAAVTTRAVSE